MARQESDREDLLREATAFIQRIELSLKDYHENLVVGFRRNGAGSIYFGPEPVFQFNTAGELRRAVRDGKLIKAEQGRLVSLTRVRQAGEVQLQRHEFSDEETADFLQFTQQRLGLLREAINQGDYTLVGQVPEESEVVNRVRQWLDSFSEKTVVADSPQMN